MLDERPARNDLTDRECAKIIGALLGGLCQMVESVETVRRAVKWWAEHPEAFEPMEELARRLKKISGGSW